ncbi:inositol monophosphatase family protein [Nocardioides bruguierae]|uniref:inositol-phosphate phosphatase n=1 Tax=Nocardioides bruguierae TaxID=2945102 RepID=A0A9X2D4S8_9ACTN|nr:inositol monophosphatase family protein [Nocardioides bruguierae]MCM0618812.1 inositol monophosphatase [Nocardioides bruguierae]
MSAPDPLVLPDAVDPGLPGALLTVAHEVAEAAASLVREKRAGHVEVAATKSSDVDVVTEADRATEELLRRLLRERRPDDAIMGEEGDDEPGTSGVRWVLDPIDGTVNFLYDLGRYSVSVAAEVLTDDGWLTVAGVVLDVADDVEHAAVLTAEGPRGTSAGRPVAVRAPQPLGQMLVATGFSYDRDLRRLQAQGWVHLLPRVRDIRRMGSCALDLCSVASGRVDAYAEEGVNHWDYAAALLVARAGGARAEVLAGVGGRTFVLCAPPASFEALHEAVTEAGLLAPA